MNLEYLNIEHEILVSEYNTRIPFFRAHLNSRQKALSGPNSNWATIALVNSSCLAN